MCARLQWPQMKCFVCDKFAFYCIRPATASKIISIWMCSVSSQFDWNGCMWSGGRRETSSSSNKKCPELEICTHKTSERHRRLSFVRVAGVKSIPIFWKVPKRRPCTRHLSALRVIRCDRVFFCYSFNVACHTPLRTLCLSFVFALWIAVHIFNWAQHNMTNNMRFYIEILSPDIMRR